MTETSEKKADKSEQSKLKKSMRNKRYYEKKKAESEYQSSETTEKEQNFFFAKQEKPEQISQPVATQPATTPNHSLRDSLIITCVPIILPFAIRLAGVIYSKTAEPKRQEQSHQQSQPQSMGSPIITLAQL